MAKPVSNKKKGEIKDYKTPNTLKLWALAVAVIGFLLYLNTVHNDYALDDSNSILENKYVQQGIDGIPGLMTVDYWYFQGLNLGYYRPLSLITFAIEKTFFGNDPHVSHFDNALLYGVTGFLLFLFLALLFPKRHPAFPFLICFLFMAHPIHTEVVANIKSRDELLSFLNIIAMSYFAYRHLKTNRPRDLVLSLVFTFLALCSKETATLGVLLLATFFFFSGINLNDTILKILPFVGVIIFFFLMKAYFLSGPAKIPTDITNYPYINQNVKWPTAFHLFWLYLQKLLIPAQLCYDYSFNQIPASKKWDAGVIAGFLAFCGLVVLALRGLKTKNTLSLSAAIYLIGIAPAMAFVVVRGGIMAERFLFASALGLALAIVYGLSKKAVAGEQKWTIKQWASANQAVLIVSLLLFSVYSYATVKRNNDWKDNMSLFKADVDKAPNSCQAHRLYGNELIKYAQKEKDTAKKRAYFNDGIRELTLTTTINPGFGEAYEQMGYAYSEVFLNVDSAIKYYTKCTEVSDFALAYNNLGTMYQNLGKLKTASYYYNRALQINPNQPDALKHSADLKKQYGLDVHEKPADEQKNLEQMQQQRLNGIAQNASEAFKENFDAGSALVKQGKYDDAIPYLEKARAAEPKNLDNLLYLANSYGLTKNYKKAIDIFQNMESISPFDTVIMNNLAATYNIIGEKEKSQEIYNNVKTFRK